MFLSFTLLRSVLLCSALLCFWAGAPRDSDGGRDDVIRPRTHAHGDAD